MRRLLLGVAGCALGLVMTGAAGAHDYPGPRPGPYGGHRPRPYPSRGTAYYADYGVRFGGGYYYPRGHHPRWEGRYWDTRYGRYEYWDPYRRCYYYWHPVRCVFVPVGCPDAVIATIPGP